MKAYVITIRGHEYSERVAQRCIDSANIEVERYDAVTPENALKVMAGHGLEWTWDTGCPITGLAHHSYGCDLLPLIACSMSHYGLWLQCSLGTENMLILEHDAVFVKPFVEFPFSTICMINDPMRATPRGNWWHDLMIKRGAGIWNKTTVFDSNRPDGIAGNSAYVITPYAAEHMVELYKALGAWPNDATMCRQLVPHMQEHYPFITEVRADMSTLRT